MAFGGYAPMGGYYQPPQQNFYVSANPVPDMLAQFKAPYQQQAAQSNYNNFIKINSEKEAEEYPVAPGNTIILWHEKDPYFYMKTADASGYQITKYEYKESTNSPEKPTEHICSCGDKFVSKEDFAALQGEIERLTQKIEAMAKPKSKLTKRLEEDDDE